MKMNRMHYQDFSCVLLSLCLSDVMRKAQSWCSPTDTASADISKPLQPNLIDLTEREKEPGSGRAADTGHVTKQLVEAVWFKIKLKPPNVFLFLTHGGGGQGLTANELRGAHAPQKVTELPRRRQVDSTEIQAAKEIDFGKCLICILKQPSNKGTRFNISLKQMTTTEAFFPCKTHRFPGS